MGMERKSGPQKKKKGEHQRGVFGPETLKGFFHGLLVGISGSIGRLMRRTPRCPVSMTASHSTMTPSRLRKRTRYKTCTKAHINQAKNPVNWRWPSDTIALALPMVAMLPL